MRLKDNKNKALILAFISLFILILSGYLVWYNYFAMNKEVQKVSTAIRISFPEKYITNNNRKINSETPEVYELLNILMAISKPGQSGKISVIQR